MNRLLAAPLMLALYIVGPVATAQAQTPPPVTHHQDPDRSPLRLRHFQLNLETPMRFGTGGPIVGIAGYAGYADAGLKKGEGSFWGAGLSLGYEGVLADDRCAPVDRTHCRIPGRFSTGPQLRLGWAWGQQGGRDGPVAYVYLYGTAFVASASDRGGSVGTRVGLAYTWDDVFDQVNADNHGGQDGGIAFLMAGFVALVAGHVEVGWEHEAIDGHGEDRGYFAVGFGY